jgi:hypothetical protein
MGQGDPSRQHQGGVIRANSARYSVTPVRRNRQGSLTPIRYTLAIRPLAGSDRMQFDPKWWPSLAVENGS